MSNGPLESKVARNIRSLREMRGMAKTDLVRRLAEQGCRIPVLGLSRAEGGQRTIDIDELHALASVFGVPVERLWEDPRCDECQGAPPLGYACLGCGARRERPSDGGAAA